MRNKENPKSKNEMGHTKKRNAFRIILLPCIAMRCEANRFDDFSLRFVHEVRVFDGVRAKFEGVDAFLVFIRAHKGENAGGHFRVGRII